RDDLVTGVQTCALPILVAGGWPSNAGAVASCELYDTTTGTFLSPSPEMLQARAGHRAQPSPDGQAVIVIGGQDAAYNETTTTERSEERRAGKERRSREG